MYPDYRNTYFPPPGAPNAANTTETNTMNTSLPPPPPLPSGRNRAHTAPQSPIGPSTSYQPAAHSHQPLASPTYSPPQYSARSSYQPSAAAHQPLASPSYTQPTSQYSTTASNFLSPLQSPSFGSFTQVAQSSAPQYTTQYASRPISQPPSPQPSPSFAPPPGSASNSSPRLSHNTPPSSSQASSSYLTTSRQSHLLSPPASAASASFTSESSTTTFRTSFACVSLHSTDRLRFLRFPSSLLPILRGTIVSVWPRGIQSEDHSQGSHEFKLKGNPWGVYSAEHKLLKGVMGDGEEGSVCSRRLMCSLLAALHGEGWVLMMSTDVSKSLWDTDTLIFRHQTPAPAKCEWFSICFSSTNRLRLIDAPPSMYSAIVNSLNRSKIEVKSKETKVEGCHEVKMLGMGWGGVHAEQAKTKLALLDILGVMEEEGWTVYASVDQKVGGESQGDTDSWYCCRPLGWIKGAPVYHN